MRAPNDLPTYIPTDSSSGVVNGTVIDRVTRTLAKLEKQDFYGELVIKVKAGKVSLLTISQALKPEDI